MLDETRERATEGETVKGCPKAPDWNEVSFQMQSL